MAFSVLMLHKYAVPNYTFDILENAKCTGCFGLYGQLFWSCWIVYVKGFKQGKSIILTKSCPAEQFVSLPPIPYQALKT